MGLNTLFKGKKVIRRLGYGRTVTLKIADIKENVHKYSNGIVAFVNYTVKFTNGETEIYNSLDDIEFKKQLWK